MRAHKSLAILALGVSAAAGCRSGDATGPSQVVCPAIAVAGLTVTLIDSATGLTPAGLVATKIRATASGFADSLVTPAPPPAWGTAYERPGTYAVSVELAGYRPWSATGLTVTKATCSVNGIVVIAKVQKG